MSRKSSRYISFIVLNILWIAPVAQADGNPPATKSDYSADEQSLPSADMKKGKINVKNAKLEVEGTEVLDSSGNEAAQRLTLHMRKDRYLKGADHIENNSDNTQKWGMAFTPGVDVTVEKPVGGKAELRDGDVTVGSMFQAQYTEMDRKREDRSQELEIGSNIDSRETLIATIKAAPAEVGYTGLIYQMSNSNLLPSELTVAASHLSESWNQSNQELQRLQVTNPSDSYKLDKIRVLLDAKLLTSDNQDPYNKDLLANFDSKVAPLVAERIRALQANLEKSKAEQEVLRTKALARLASDLVDLKKAKDVEKKKNDALDATAHPYATAGVYVVSLGAKYKKDVVAKTELGGGKVSIVSGDFHVAGKLDFAGIKNIPVGICGSVEPLELVFGQSNGKEKVTNKIDNGDGTSSYQDSVVDRSQVVSVLGNYKGCLELGLGEHVMLRPSVSVNTDYQTYLVLSKDLEVSTWDGRLAAGAAIEDDKSLVTNDRDTRYLVKGRIAW